MPAIRTLFRLVLAALLPTGSLELVAAEPKLLIGAAEVEITPQVGFQIAGYYHERLATGTKDPLKAKALVLRSSETQVALVACDLTGISYDLTAEVRERVSRSTGIPPRAIILCGTHSHTAPDYGRNLFDLLASQKAPAGDPAPYSSRLIAGISQAIENASRQAAPGVLQLTTARQETPVSFNRRFVMKDGTVKTWQSLSTPGVVRAAGPIDPEIGIVVARTIDGNRPLATLTNFALHLDTVGGLEWSADYPYFIEQTLRKELGGDVVSVFGLGCCGDINHVNPASTERNKTDSIGNALARTIVAALPKVTPIATPRLRVVSEIVQVPLQDPGPAEVEKSRQYLTAIKEGAKPEFFEQVASYKTIMLDQFQNSQPAAPPANWINWGLSHRLAGIGPTLPVEVHAITVGEDLAIVCLPGEVFVELGLAIKQGSPFKTTLVIELSNFVETIYIPNRQAYAQGSYEVTNSALQPGSGEMLVEAALRLLREAAK